MWIVESNGPRLGWSPAQKKEMDMDRIHIEETKRQHHKKELSSGTLKEKKE